jgi:DNA-binding transcriptional MerR regulator
MRIGELSARSGVPVTTIKYYLREGMLPARELTCANQAHYGDAHLRRLELVRALVDVGGLSIATVREVLKAVDGSYKTPHEALDFVQHSITPPLAVEHDDEAEREARRFLARHGWEYDDDNAAVQSIVAVLATARRLGHDHFADRLDPYADACRRIAEADDEHVPGNAEVADVAERLVVDTVLCEAALRAMHRLGWLEKDRRPQR